MQAPNHRQRQRARVAEDFIHAVQITDHRHQVLRFQVRLFHAVSDRFNRVRRIYRSVFRFVILDPMTPGDSGNSFATCPHGENHTAKILGKDTCLDVPKIFPGGHVTLMGLNFLSTKCRIRIRRLINGNFLGAAEVYEAELKPSINEDPDPNLKIPDIPCGELFGDTTRPDNVATCSVEDIAHFEMPQRYDARINKLVIPTGFYEIRLIVPNEDNFAFEALVGNEKKSIAPDLLPVISYMVQ
jgi:hypothetical protein